MNILDEYARQMHIDAGFMEIRTDTSDEGEDIRTLLYYWHKLFSYQPVRVKDLECICDKYGLFSKRLNGGGGKKQSRYVRLANILRAWAGSLPMSRFIGRNHFTGLFFLNESPVGITSAPANKTEGTKTMTLEQACSVIHAYDETLDRYKAFIEENICKQVEKKPEPRKTYTVEAKINYELFVESLSEAEERRDSIIKDLESTIADMQHCLVTWDVGEIEES